MSSRTTLQFHLNHHNIRRWLRQMAKDDDARTIYEAVTSASRRQIRRLKRAMARILAD